MFSWHNLFLGVFEIFVEVISNSLVEFQNIPPEAFGDSMILSSTQMNRIRV